MVILKCGQAISRHRPSFGVAGLPAQGLATVAGCSSEHPAQSSGKAAASASQSAMAPGKRCIIAPWARGILSLGKPFFHLLPGSLFRSFLSIALLLLSVPMIEKKLFLAAHKPDRPSLAEAFSEKFPALPRE